jgi:prominin 1
LFSGFVRVKGGEVVISEDWMGLGLHYWWLGVVVLCALLLGAALPLVGLLFCCCRCAGRCGARSQPYDKRYDTCRRHFYAFLLSVTTVLIMYVTFQYIYLLIQ